MAELLTCEWVRRADNLLLSGAAGTGKTWLGCALGIAAVELGLSARYVRTNLTLEEMRLAHLDGSIGKVRSSLVSADLLILDDFGIAPISEQAKEDLLELLEGRIDQGATMVIGQLDPESPQYGEGRPRGRSHAGSGCGNARQDPGCRAGSERRRSREVIGGSWAGHLASPP